LRFAIWHLKENGILRPAKIKDKAIPPCIFKQVKTRLIANNR
jgi:hypothetical protein